MVTDKIRKYVLPNIPYLFIGWFCLKIGTAYRLAAGTGFGEKLLGLGQTIGAAFASFAPGLAPLDWFVGIVGAAGFRLLIYCKAKKAKKFRRDAEYGTARWAALSGERAGVPHGDNHRASHAEARGPVRVPDPHLHTPRRGGGGRLRWLRHNCRSRAEHRPPLRLL